MSVIDGWLLTGGATLAGHELAVPLTTPRPMPIGGILPTPPTPVGVINGGLVPGCVADGGGGPADGGGKASTW